MRPFNYQFYGRAVCIARLQKGLDEQDLCDLIEYKYNLHIKPNELAHIERTGEASVEQFLYINMELFGEPCPMEFIDERRIRGKDVERV